MNVGAVPVLKTLADYVASAMSTDLPESVEEKARQHLLDTCAAMVSGSELPPGRTARAYVRSQRSAGPASVVGEAGRVSVTLAALANGMCAHADESNGAHAPSHSQPGCSVGPAALAAAEQAGRSLRDVVRAMALGFDVGARAIFAIGRDELEETATSTHAVAGIFGATVAASGLLGLDRQHLAWALSYCAQQMSGLTTVFTDVAHVEKAFVFGGMPASNGMRAAEFAAADFVAVDDVLEGPHNWLDAFPWATSVGALVDELGSRFEISVSDIKKYCVASFAQSVIEASRLAAEAGRVGHRDIEEIHVYLPNPAGGLVARTPMPNLSIPYLVAVTLIDGSCGFDAAHDRDRMSSDPTTIELMGRVHTVSEPDMANRSARVILTTTDGRRIEKTVARVRGTRQNPMTTGEVVAKANELMAPVLGHARSCSVTQLLTQGDLSNSVEELTHVLRQGPS